jgi:hypothetical protein
VDGKFYDASSYKASPVPMALDSETVYEGMLSGVSQGLFTVSGALHGPNNSWIGEGTWKSAAAIAAKKAAPSAKPRNDDDLDAPPVLRHPDSAKPKPPAPTTSETKPQSVPPAPVAEVPPAPSTQTPADDKEHPVLRRGKPAPAAPEKENPEAIAPRKASSPGSVAKPETASLQSVPAISDAGGPDPRPYSYDAKPQEEQQLRKKMLGLAADEVRARAQHAASEPAEPAKSNSSMRARKLSTVSKPQPDFEDVQFRIFDLSNSNEPVLVLTTTATPPVAKESAATQTPYFVTLVARQDINGDLHKAFSNVTDAEHLDALPRLELIDAVDADGDSRGELLFRQVSDAGTAYSVYRVIGNQLYPLFQGSPGQ